jgi:hydroxypyruvate isomerase
MPRFSANLGHLFPELPLIERIGAAASAGFKAIELQQPYELAPSAVKAEIDRHGLTMLNLNSPASAAGEAGLAAVAGREAEFQARIDQALDYAVSLGVAKIHAMAGDGLNTPENARAFVNNIRAAGEKAAARGKTILIEPINPRDRPNYFLRSTIRAADFIVEVGLANVKLQFDAYHVALIEGDAIRRLKEFAPLIGHVQIAGVPARHEPDEGDVDYPAFFAALDGIGYDGWVGAEYRPRARTEDGLGWAKPNGIVPR